MTIKREISTKRTLLAVFLSYVLLIISQIAALLIAQLVVMTGLPDIIGSLISGILYVAFTFLSASVICQKVLNQSLSDCKISKFTLKPVWAVSAFILPVLVSVILLFTGGHWEKSYMDAAELGYKIVDAVVFFGFAAGFSEEIIFRGMIMSSLENRWNKRIAVFIPSVFFAVSHVIGVDLDLVSIIQLLIAGSVVGVLFSFVTYQSDNVWNSGLMHSVWNIIMIGGILHIGAKADDNCLINYVLDHKSFLVTGGDFGIEASMAAIVGYVVFILLAVFLIRKREVA